MPRRAGTLIAVAFAALIPVAAGLAQDAGAQPSPILTIDSERVFGVSAIGRKITSELEADLEALATENRSIEAELTAEEQALTTQRAKLSPEEFRPLADAFDDKVQRIRTEQDAKQRDLQARRDAERQNFIERIAPILAAIGRERGAIVILERRSVVLSAESADVTDEVITRINAALEDGADPAPAGNDEPPAPEPAPESEPAPE